MTDVHGAHSLVGRSFLNLNSSLVCRSTVNHAVSHFADVLETQPEVGNYRTKSSFISVPCLIDREAGADARQYDDPSNN